ncbi:MAG: PP2C family protein-serine/threonine phosphatase, partial [Bacteroidia bacterium]
IVAGDFYWMEVVNNIIFIAAGDCTGHGVPGAMVSVVCSNALNRAVLEFGISEPGKILDKTRELVLETFSRSDADVKDGMDISLISIAKIPGSSAVTVKWAGANNPLWYVSNKEPKEIKADKQAIGKTENPYPFTTHTIQLQKGDILFLFTDGYADQFGGDKGKKIKSKPLKEMLVSNSIYSSAEQKEKLEVAFREWKGNIEQVDDVCIIGIRI